MLFRHQYNNLICLCLKCPFLFSRGFHGFLDSDLDQRLKQVRLCVGTIFLTRGREALPNAFAQQNFIEKLVQILLVRDGPLNLLGRQLDLSIRGPSLILLDDSVGCLNFLIQVLGHLLALCLSPILLRERCGRDHRHLCSSLQGWGRLGLLCR